MKERSFNVQTQEWEERELTPEEIAAMQELENLPLPEIPYEQRVVDLIRQKYSVDDELAIQRQKDEKPDEWQDYYDFCELCKQEVRAEMGLT